MRSIGGWEYSCCKLLSCQNERNNALLLHKHSYSWVIKTRNSPEVVLGNSNNIPLGHHTDLSPMGLGQYNSLGEYYGPHNASSVFLILILYIVDFGHLPSF